MYDELSMNSNKTSFADEDMEEEKRLAIHMNHAFPDQATCKEDFFRSSQKLPAIVLRNEPEGPEELLEDDNNNSSVQNIHDLDFSITDNCESLTGSMPLSKASFGDDSPMTAMGVSLVVEEVDDKKRPLSITSTSSSSSSTRSVSCNHRKKHASCTMTLCGVTTSLSVASGDDVASDSLATVSEDSSGNCACNGACCRMFDDYAVEYSCASSAVSPSFQRERFRSFSGCTTQMLTGGVWHRALPTAKSDSDVMVTGTADAVRGIDTGQMLVNSEEETASIPSHSESPYIDRVVMEILETERTYVRDLKDIIDGYVNYLCKSSEFDLQPADQDALFGNIQDIYVFNRNFLKLLEEFGHDPTRVAKCFVDQNDGFAIYSEYCTNYPRSMEVLTEYMKDSIKASIVKRQQMALRHALPLGSYLLKPVQRILKYHLLLLNILNHHDADSDDHKVIEQAVESMTSMARHINDMKQRHEHAIRTQEIQSMLYEWDGADHTTLGDLILEDKFRLCGAKAERTIFLFEKAVLIAKRKDEGSLIVKAFIMCCNLMLIESIPKEPLCFHMIPFDCPRIQYTVQTRSLEQKRLWCQHLKQLILDNYTAVIPEKAKELVMTLGKSREEEMLGSSVENVDHVRKQHSAPQYLQKRRRKSAGLIFEFKLKPRSGPRKSEPSTQAGPLLPSQVRRNSDIAEFLGDAMKNKEKSGLSPRMGLMKKGYFWSKDGTENSNSAFDTSAESIKSSLAADSTEAVCSCSTANKGNDTNSSLAENPDSLSVTEDVQKPAERSPTKDCTPKDWKSAIPAIRSTSIAHKDSISISKTKHVNSSSTLNSKDLCRQRCVKTKSKSIVGLHSEEERQMSLSFAKNPLSEAKDGTVRPSKCSTTNSLERQSEFSKDGEVKRPRNGLRVFLTSEDNFSTDLLADQCTGERSDLGDDAIETADKDDNSKRMNTRTESSSIDHFRRVLGQIRDEPLLETSFGMLCSKCGCCLPPFNRNKSLACDDRETCDDYGTLSSRLCLECASSKLESEMAQLNEYCGESGNDSDNISGNSSEESLGNEETLGSDGGSDGCEEKSYQFQMDDHLYTLKEDQLEELAKHLMISREILLNSGESCETTAGSAELNAKDLHGVEPSAGTDGSSLFNVEQAKQKAEDMRKSTHPGLETDSRKCTEETEGSINGIVDSLRNTVTHFLSKLTHKNSPELARGSPGSPRNGTANGDIIESPKTASHSKDARYRIVYALARAYSNRSKQLEVSCARNNDKLKVEKDKDRQLTMLLRGNELGSQIIGERMAQATPHTLDRTLSLVSQRHGKRKAHAAKNDISKSPVIHAKEVSFHTEEVSSDKENSDQTGERSYSSFPTKHTTDATSAVSVRDDRSLYGSGRGLEGEEEEGKKAFESYYEKQLSLDLEDGSPADAGSAPS